MIALAAVPDVAIVAVLFIVAVVLERRWQRRYERQVQR